MRKPRPMLLDSEVVARCEVRRDDITGDKERVILIDGWFTKEEAKRLCLFLFRAIDWTEESA